ncbi:hypothetical protein F444_20002 [Phytophthora nicotianae P1976]|uniref:Peptidase S33 tripeptidyl aminopeptidase-like C-terminal domain-containing protein n=1 Tax=Phytophthora nicotianae P1976 TaxID=1317066 RepID=A0A080Z5Z7_PHYNI|nr:hypothetical protein F444_20002 [Phytophthora nicotianae P1976]
MHLASCAAIAVTTICTLGMSTATSQTYRLNGWYPCSNYTFSDSRSSDGLDAECATFAAPLCYPGICETPEFATPTITIFVKRIPATNGDPKNASNVWMLEGGPELASTSMERDMVKLHSMLEGNVNVYTMDHRGTGQSTLLDCLAAQVTTFGSPWGDAIGISEVGSCANALENEYGDLASFSMTSAATDISTFITEHSNGASTIVYGISYGTALVERLMHVAPPHLKEVSSGAGPNNFPFISKWDMDFGEVGDAFLKLCARDRECSFHFSSSGLFGTLQDVINQFDRNPNSTCAALVTEAYKEQSSDPPSLILRRALGNLLPGSMDRKLIPPIVYRLNRCEANDAEVLTNFFATLNSVLSETSTDQVYESSLLNYLIIYSELWETPTPSFIELQQRFKSTRMSDVGIYDTKRQYCAFTKEDSETCNQESSSNYSGNGIVYQRDEYWNKSATIPIQASVLLMQGTLDPKTPAKYADYLLETLVGDNKELVSFNYATHGTITSTRLVEGDPTSETCGMKIFASYVRSEGDLSRLDKSYVNARASFNWTANESRVLKYLGTNDAYDGKYLLSQHSNEGIGSGESGSQ